MKQEIKNSNGEVFCTITADQSTNTVTDTWLGNFGSQDNFKKAIEQWLETVKKEKAAKTLTNLQEMKGSFDSSRQWLIEQIMPKAVKSGLKYQAIILPKSVFSKLSTKDYMIQAGELQIGQFDEIKSAEQWLKSQN